MNTFHRYMRLILDVKTVIIHLRNCSYTFRVFPWDQKYRVVHFWKDSKELTWSSCRWASDSWSDSITTNLSCTFSNVGLSIFGVDMNWIPTSTPSKTSWTTPCLRRNPWGHFYHTLRFPLANGNTMPEWATSLYWMQRESRLTVVFSQENIIQMFPCWISSWCIQPSFGF